MKEITLNNPKSCLNAVRYADKKCNECSLNEAFVYEKKGQYGKGDFMEQELTDAIFKTTERWLHNFKSWQAEIIVLETNLEDHSGKVTVSYGGIGGGSGGQEDGLFGTAVALMNDEERLERLKSKVRVVEAAIESLGYDERIIIIMKYFEKRPVKIICEKMFLDDDAYKRRRRKAMREIIRILSVYQVFKVDVNRRLEKVS